jgi:hypothetical protein
VFTRPREQFDVTRPFAEPVFHLSDIVSPFAEYPFEDATDEAAVDTETAVLYFRACARRS